MQSVAEAEKSSDKPVSVLVPINFNNLNIPHDTT